MLLIKYDSDVPRSRVNLVSVPESANQPTNRVSRTWAQQWYGTKTPRDSDKERLLYSGETARICTRTEVATSGGVQ